MKPKWESIKLSQGLSGLTLSCDDQDPTISTVKTCGPAVFAGSYQSSQHSSLRHILLSPTARRLQVARKKDFLHSLSTRLSGRGRDFAARRKVGPSFGPLSTEADRSSFCTRCSWVLSFSGLSTTTTSPKADWGLSRFGLGVSTPSCQISDHLLCFLLQQLM